MARVWSTASGSPAPSGSEAAGREPALPGHRLERVTRPRGWKAAKCRRPSRPFAATPKQPGTRLTVGLVPADG